MKLTPNNRNIIFEYYVNNKYLAKNYFKKNIKKIHNYHNKFFAFKLNPQPYRSFNNTDIYYHYIGDLYIEYLTNNKDTFCTNLNLDLNTTQLDNMNKKSNKILNIYEKYYFYEKCVFLTSILCPTFCILDMFQVINQSFLIIVGINIIAMFYSLYKCLYYEKRIHKLKTINCGFTDYK